MTTQDPPAAPGRLAFGATFGAAFSTVFGRFWSFAKAALLPVALSILLTIASFALLATGEPQELAGLILEILGLLPLTILGIACSRLVLIGRQAGAIPRPLFGRRTFIYLGYSLLLGIIAALPVVIYSLAIGFASRGSGVAIVETDPEAAHLQYLALLGWGLPLLFFFYLVYFYLIVRLSLVLPAIAVDNSLGLAGSWRLTRGASGFKLYTVLVVIMLLCVVGTLITTVVINILVGLLWFTPGMPTQPDDIDWVMVGISAVPTALIGLLAQFISFALIVVAMASAYAQLSGWGAPREEILERFE